MSKYTDDLPLYRIEQIGTRPGVPLALSTLAEWTGKIGVALQPLSECLAELLKERACFHADETPVRQLDAGTPSLASTTKRADFHLYQPAISQAPCWQQTIATHETFYAT
jgi:hypothetical protein